MINKSTLTVAAFIAAILVMPRFAFAEGEAAALGQAVDLTGGSLPEEIRNFTGVGSGASSWDYLSQKISYGYYVEVYSHFDALAKSKVDRRNGIEDLVVASYGTDAKANLAIADVKFNQDYAQHVMATEFAQRSGRGTQIANTYTLNTYLPHSDGSVEYFKDGLLARVDNQRSVDEFGNVSIKNLYNFEYDLDRRLMLKHEYDTTDSRGLKTHGTFTCSYTADSVFYGSDETNANKHYASYTVTETDSTGRVMTTTWTAGVYEGKYLRDFTQTNFDSKEGTSTFKRFNIQYSAPGQISSYDETGVGNHIEGEDGTNVPFTYTLSRTNITYYGGQVAGYDEVRYDMPANMEEADFDADLSKWVKTTTHVTMEYLDVPSQFGEDVDPDAPRLKKTTIVSHTEKPDGSYDDSTAVTEYTYDNTYTLTGGTIHTEMSGRGSETIEYTFTDKDGTTHILTRTEKDGVVKFTYTDEDGNEVEVAEADVVTEIKPAADYSGYTDTVLEIVSGTPMAKTTTSHTEFRGIADDPENGTKAGDIIRVEDSTVTFTNSVVGYFPRVISSTEVTTTGFPVTDPDNEHQSKKSITTTFTYDANGFLTGASGEGYEESWSYSSEQGWNTHIYAKYTVAYQVKLDKALNIATYVQWVPVPSAAELTELGITEEQFKAYMRGYFKLHPPEPKGDATTFEMDNPFIIDGKYEIPSDFDEVVAIGESDEPVAPAADPFAGYDEQSLMKQVWGLYDAKDYARTVDFANEVIKRYAETAQEQQASLKDFAPKGSESKYWALNDVAIAYYIKGKVLLAQGKTDQAKKQFQAVLNKYSFGQCWDPQGWFWKVSVAAKEELDKIG